MKSGTWIKYDPEIEIPNDGRIILLELVSKDDDLQKDFQVMRIGTNITTIGKNFAFDILSIYNIKGFMLIDKPKFNI